MKVLLANWVLAILLVATGCVMVPYTPDAEIERLPAQTLAAEDVILTIGPRRFLEEMSTQVASRERRVVVEPALDFRDTVFPEGNWTLANLLAPASQSRIARSGVDFLVALGPVSYAEDESDNKMAIWIGFYGVADVGTEAGLSALVIDLSEGRTVDLLVANSEAAFRGVGLFYGVFMVPRTQHGVKEAVGRELAAVLGDVKPTGPIRVVLMAAESAVEGRDALTGLEQPSS